MDRSNRFRFRAASRLLPARAASVEGLQRRLFLAAQPTVTAAEFIFDDFPTRQTVALTFSANVEASLEEQDINLRNLTTSSIVAENTFGIDFDEDTNVASISFDGSFPFHALPDGNYRLTLPAGSVQDADGNVLESTSTFDFFVLAGDANRDRIVDVADLGILASNWQQESRTFSTGDFSYDGKVDVEDLGLLATNWQKFLTPPSSFHAAARPTRAIGQLTEL